MVKKFFNFQMLKITSRSEAQTIKLGARLIRRLGPGDIVCLFGVLGAAKTILVKGMAQGLGINKNEVISPSFVLLREYLFAGRSKLKIPLYHFDLYRLSSPKDILNLGCEEYFYGQGICVIEWAQRLSGYLPLEFLKIELEVRGETKRLIKLSAKGKRYRRCLLHLENRSQDEIAA